MTDLTGDGGVVKYGESKGEGGLPKTGDRVHVHYTGTLQDTKEEFDTSLEFGDAYSKPFAFVLGGNTTIRGFDIAARSMCVGERSRFVMRSDYAYGDVGAPGRGMAPDIPPGATLEFSMTMVKVERGASCGEDDENPKTRELKALRKKRAAEAARAKKAREEKKKRAEAAKKKKKGDEKDASKKEGPLDARSIKKMKPKELKKALKARGLSYQGSKKELTKRLLEAVVVKNG